MKENRKWNFFQIIFSQRAEILIGWKEAQETEKCQVRMNDALSLSYERFFSFLQRLIDSNKAIIKAGLGFALRDELCDRQRFWTD